MDTHRSKKYYALSSNSFAWSASPPSTSFLINSIESYRLSRVVYRDPYFSNPEDVPPTAREFGGRRFVLKGDSIKYLPSFAHETASSKGIGRPFVKKRGGITKWEYAARPPTPLQARTWIAENQSAVEDRAGITSQVCPTPQLLCLNILLMHCMIRFLLLLKSTLVSRSRRRKEQSRRSRRSSI